MDRAHRDEWEEMASADPMWAVLSDPDRKFGSWDWRDFLSSGELEFHGVLELLGRYLPGLQPRRVLDFGCGLGRVTSAIAAEVDFCLGVDLSLRMLTEARTATPRNREGKPAFLEGDVETLGCFRDGSFDLVYSRHVLQHLPTHSAIGEILTEFLRLLSPDGALVVQIPSGLPLAVRVQPRRILYRFLKGCGISHRALYWWLGLHPMRMRSMRRDEVDEILGRAGGCIVAVQETKNRWYGYRDATYLACRSESTSEKSSR